MKECTRACERGRYWRVLIVAFVFALCEFIGGAMLASGALKGDAWHLFTDAGTDALAFGIALGAARFPTLEHRWRRWGGYIQAGMLALAGVLILKEAYVYEPRFIKAEGVIIIGLVAVAVNYARYKILHPQGSFWGTAWNVLCSLLQGKKEMTTYIAELIHVVIDIGVSVLATAGGILMFLKGGDSQFDFLASHAMAGLVFIGVIIVVVFAGRHEPHHH